MRTERTDGDFGLDGRKLFDGTGENMTLELRDK